MPFERSKAPTLVVRLALFVSCLSVILVLACGASAQTLIVTPNPTSVRDAATPSDVVLSVIKSDGTPVDQTFPNQLGTVKVGEATAIIKETTSAGSVTIAPPANLAGSQTVRLLDKNNQLLGQTQLQYPAQSATATATPAAIEVRQNSLSQSWWYRVSVIGLFLLVVGIFVYTLYRVIAFSRSSFRNPLGFPVGSFRSMLAFTLVAFLGFYVFASVLSMSTFPPPESLLGIVATVIGFYFGSRSNEEGAMDSGVAGIVRGIVTAGPVPARGAVVKFRRDDGTEPYIRVTDIEGRFTPVSAKPGKYTVHASLTGMPDGEVKLTVAEGSDQEIVIALKPVVTSP